MFESIAVAQAVSIMIQSKHRYRVEELYGYSFPDMGPRKIWAMAPPKPCHYCGRTRQEPGRESCDGCGAPR